MKLNNLHLTVDDVPATRSFLERHFGPRPSGEGHKISSGRSVDRQTDR
jgi:hypothetical protein